MVVDFLQGGCGFCCDGGGYAIIFFFFLFGDNRI